MFDTVLVNTAEAREDLREVYLEQQAEPVLQDIENLEAMGLRVIAHDLLGQTTKIRHQPDLLASILVDLAAEHVAGGYSDEPSQWDSISA